MPGFADENTKKRYCCHDGKQTFDATSAKHVTLQRVRRSTIAYEMYLKMYE